MKLTLPSPRTRAGFTLIEIMIVVAIIGLLVAALLPSITQARMKASARACITQLVRIQTTKQAWAMENHKADDAIPTEADLFGTGKYLDKSQCPSGGTLTLNAVSQKAACSVAGHVLE